MNKKNLKSFRAYKFSAELCRIGNNGIEHIKRENKSLNLPLVFSKNGNVYFELPDGRIVTEYKF